MFNCWNLRRAKRHNNGLHIAHDSCHLFTGPTLKKQQNIILELTVRKWPPFAPIGPHCSHWPPLAPVSPLAPIGPRWPPLATIGPRWPTLAPIGSRWHPLAPIGSHWSPFAIPKCAKSIVKLVLSATVKQKYEFHLGLLFKHIKSVSFTGKPKNRSHRDPRDP